MKIKQLLVALILGLGLTPALVGALGFGLVPIAYAATCTVGTTHGSIQTAVNDPSCDSIIVPEGTYFEHITINRSLTLQGAGARSTFIDGGESGRVVNITAGTVFISGVTIQNGKLTGGIGAGILTLGNLTLSDSTISNNTAGQGSGIYTYEATVTVNNSTISGNESYLAPSLGGAIFKEYGNLTLNNSTVSGNRGDGIINIDSDTLTISNSTISNNEGSGIYNVFIWPPGTSILKNTMVVSNAGGYGSGDCYVFAAAITSAGYNMDSDNTCNLTATGDITNSNPLLGPLQDNGGATDTHALLPGSPAIDAGSCSGTTTDQRGKLRPVDIPDVANADNGCDIGAYEIQPELTLSKTVNNTEPAFGERITYTIAITNSGLMTATNALISDTLPMSITFAGPVTLEPDQSNAVRATSALSLPILAANVTITPQTSITLTVPVTVNLNLTDTTTPIINTAAVTCTEISSPVIGQAIFGGNDNIYLPIVFKILSNVGGVNLTKQVRFGVIIAKKRGDT